VKSIEKSHLNVGAHSHVGEIRPKNEDHHAIAYFQAPTGELVTVGMVADGIGGHQAGEIASELTVKTVLDVFQETDFASPLQTLSKAINQASKIVNAIAIQKPDKQGMGSTLAMAVVSDDRLYIVNVGDSRVYLLRQDEFRQISIDHTWVQEAIEHEIITKEEARGHPNANVLQSYIGSTELPKPDFRLQLDEDESPEESLNNQGLQLLPGDRILLCSDGLSDLVSDDEIHRALQSNSPANAARSLTSLARSNGGTDNVTVVILEYPFPAEEKTGKLRKGRMAGLLLLAILTMAIMVSTWWLGWWNVPAWLPW
jgi:serine/threonine protein phosphatase PrpC